MIESAQEFIRLRISTDPDAYRRAAHEPAPESVWEELVRDHAEMRQWVVQNKTVPESILALLHNDPSADVRCTVARKRKLPKHLQAALATDPDASVRHALAHNSKLDSGILLQLSEDAEEFVREAAIKRLQKRQDGES